MEGAWDIDNAIYVQYWLWANKSTVSVNKLSLKAMDLGLTLDEDFTNRFFVSGPYRGFEGFMNYKATLQKCDFLVSRGMDINCKDPEFKQTPLLSVAEADGYSSFLWMRALLHHGANVADVDHKGRGPLHLSLKQGRNCGFTKEETLHTMKQKIILLLRAGCSVDTVDDAGRSPYDFFRQNTSLKELWMDALHELGMRGEENLVSCSRQVKSKNPF